MRPRPEILHDAVNTNNWTDRDQSRRTNCIQLILEAAVDIRDILDTKLFDIMTEVESLSEALGHTKYPKG